MISFFEGNSLPKINKISFAATDCLISAFGDSALSPEVWVQTENGRITAVISRFGGRVNLTYMGGDKTEIKDFLNIIGFSEIFTEKGSALALGFDNFSTFTVLKKEARKQKDFSEIPSLKGLYNALLEGKDGDVSLPSFEDFAADISHRLRHGGAVALLEDFGAALAFKSEFGGIINGISVKKGLRGRGLGGKLLKNICEYLNGDIFVCTNEKTAEFYIKNGFEPYGLAVLIRG